MYKARRAMLGVALDDPWYRYITDGTCAQWVPTTSVQAYPPVLAPAAQDKSNKFANFGGVGCPEFDYDTWKQIAQSGGSDVHYYAWDNGTDFRENGVGTATDYRALTDNKQGLFFFDTKDGIAPHDFDSNGVAVNLTPEMKILELGYAGLPLREYGELQQPGFARATPSHALAERAVPGCEQNGKYDAGEEWVNRNSPRSTTDPTVKPTIACR